MKIYIVAVGEYCENIDSNIDDSLPNLKLLVKAAVGNSVRRISRFIQLALIGAGRTAAELPSKTAVYLSSGRGDIEVTVNALNSIYCQHEPPKPLNFVNTVSNAATFYVVQCLGLQGSSSFITSRYFSLERALKSACVDLHLRRIDSALVGVVDVVTVPLAMHRQRLGLAESTTVAEASHWLQLVKKPNDYLVLATLESIQNFPSRKDLLTWLAQQTLADDMLFAAGQYLSVDEASEYLMITGLTLFSCHENVGHFDSQVGRILCQFINASDKNKNKHLLYVNRDPHGRYMALILSRESSLQGSNP